MAAGWAAQRQGVHDMDHLVHHVRPAEGGPTAVAIRLLPSRPAEREAVLGEQAVQALRWCDRPLRSLQGWGGGNFRQIQFWIGRI